MVNLQFVRQKKLQLVKPQFFLLTTPLKEKNTEKQNKKKLQFSFAR